MQDPADDSPETHQLKPLRRETSHLFHQSKLTSHHSKLTTNKRGRPGLRSN